MNRLNSFIGRLIQVAVIGLILVQTKRRLKWLFWPIFVSTNLFLSPWIAIGIFCFIDLFILQFIFGLVVELRDLEWLIWLIWIPSFFVLIPALYNAINLIEETIHGSRTEISFLGKFVGYIWGWCVTLFVLYRLDFFKYLY